MMRAGRGTRPGQSPRSVLLVLTLVVACSSGAENVGKIGAEALGPSDVAPQGIVDAESQAFLAEAGLEVSEEQILKEAAAVCSALQRGQTVADISGPYLETAVAAGMSKENAFILLQAATRTALLETCPEFGPEG